jgi:hypothetical protein
MKIHRGAHRVRELKRNIFKELDMVMDALGDAGLLNDETMDLDSFRIDLKDMSEQFYGRSIKTISVFSASTPSPLLHC